jgi:tRNA threonylcarbamoyladenosine biosynthesis protein TsaB
MRVLAIDAATEACSAALLDATGLRWRYEEIGRGHAERLPGMIAEVLDEANTPLAAVDVLAASIGPGAFTGVRITVATAQGLAFGAALPVIPISTLEALAWQALYGDEASRARTADGAPILACLDARMGEVYWGTFAGDGGAGLVAQEPPRVSAPGEVLPAGGRHHGIGRGFASYPALEGLAGLQIDAAARRALPDARAIARLASARGLRGAAVDAADLVPLYVRDKVALTEVERAASSHCHIEKL